MTDPINGVSWRDYVDAQLNALERAVDKSEQQLRERLAGMNEIREAMRDQAARYATRESVDLTRQQQAEQIDKLLQRIENLEKAQAHAAGQARVLGAVLSIGLTLLSIALRFIG